MKTKIKIKMKMIMKMNLNLKEYVHGDAQYLILEKIYNKFLNK
jgi:hypothetical protein